MPIQNYPDRQKQAGFTLVELAIVMIIIGLLIGGILKGQELIANAQVTSTVAQIKGIDAAASTFSDQYNSFPGDMRDATTRLPNCAAPCGNGDGNGRLNTAVGAAPVLTNEGTFFFNQIFAADLITGMDGTNTLEFGKALPASSIGGGYTAGHSAVAPTGFNAGDLRASHYLVMTGTTGAVAANTGALIPTQAARIDRKMDDGIASTGSVVSETTAACRLVVGGDTLYNEANDSQLCSIAIRIQN